MSRHFVARIFCTLFILTSFFAFFPVKASAQTYRQPIAVWSFDGMEFPSTTAIFPANCGRLYQQANLYFGGEYNSYYPYSLQFSTSNNDPDHNPCLSNNPEQSLQVKLQSSNTSGNIWICAAVLNFNRHGFNDLYLEYDLRVTSYGAKTYLFQYSTTGSGYTSFDTVFVPVSDYDNFIHYAYDLERIPALQGVDDIFVRIIIQNATSANGTACIDNIAISGTKCVDTTVLDTVSVCHAYTWIGNTYTESGSYYDLIERQDICDSLTILPLNILLLPDATISATPLSDSTELLSIAETGLEGYTFAWTANGVSCGNDSTLTVSVFPPHDVYYCVTVTSPEGCKSEGCYLLHTHVGMESLSSSNLKIYPNPAEDFVVIQGAPLHSISLYDAKGQLVKQFGSIHSNEQMIELKGMPAGLYLLDVVLENGEGLSRKLLLK